MKSLNSNGNLEGAHPALLFIPDISGFTNFVTNTELSHSKHIIEELLEVMMDANDINMEVSEIEGDAILYYRFGQAPTAAELLAQIQKMFVRFHAHLKKYESHRICNCGACKTANSLTLKFIAHYGDIAMNQVKQYKKLFGKDVIVAHRLLKNDIEHHEYALVTHPLVKACPQWVDVDTVAWAPVQHSEQDYDSGKVSFCYLPLAPLMAHVPEPKTEDFSIPGVKSNILSVEGVVDAPLEMVFDVCADLPWRHEWIVGTIPIEEMNHKILQVGSTHRCIANQPIAITHDVKATDKLITYTETDDNRKACTVYTLRKLEEGKTLVQLDFFMKRNFLMELMFKLMMKKKYKNIVDTSMANLQNYCKSLLEKGEEHPYSIVLKTEELVLTT